MSREQSNRIAYLVACVGAFAERHGLSNQSSYQYLRLYKGTDFLRDYYDIEHTFSIDEAVEDLTVICQRNGGALAWNYIMAITLEQFQKKVEYITPTIQYFFATERAIAFLHHE